MKYTILYFVVFAFLITPTVYAQDDDALEGEVEMNEGAGEGDIEEQIQTGADEAALLNGEAEVIELENEEIYEMLYGEDQELRSMASVEPPPGWVWCSVGCKSNPEGAQVYFIPLHDWETNLNSQEDIDWISKYPGPEKDTQKDTWVVWESALQFKYRAVFILNGQIESTRIDVRDDKTNTVEVTF